MAEVAPKFLDRHAEIVRHKTNLPHWQQPGSTFFVTFRLADSLPASLLAPWREARDAWFLLHPKPWDAEREREYHARFTDRIEQWLDAGHGACILRDPAAARAVGESLAHFEGERCRQHAWVVMPNHVHVLFSLVGDWRLEQLVHSWKSFSAHQINAVLYREGTLWQRDYHDRLVRDAAHFERCRAYIMDNPRQAGLGAGSFLAQISP